MAKQKVSGDCKNCSNTGLLSASLVREEEGGRHIAVVVCGGHYNNDAAEKNMHSMHDQTGLAIEVVQADKSAEKASE